jgi:enamine deaminase RidA (YjgF/YER057c/UK114 family)
VNLEDKGMTTTTNRNPETIHAPVGAYTHHVEVAANARWLAMAGQIGKRRDGSVPEEPIEQLEVALENVRHNLEAAGMGVENIVKITWYFVGDANPTRRREVIGRWLGEHRAASTLLFVVALAAPEYKVEVDAWAAR